MPEHTWSRRVAPPIDREFTCAFTGGGLSRLGPEERKAYLDDPKSMEKLQALNRAWVRKGQEEKKQELLAASQTEEEPD